MNICLSNNQLHKQGGVDILSIFLSENPRLDELWVPDNLLIDDNTVLIINALKNNTNLKIFNIFHNEFLNRGLRAFQKLIYDDSSLAPTADSNHTIRHLSVKRSGIDPYVSNHVIGGSESDNPEENKRSKMRIFLTEFREKEHNFIGRPGMSAASV